MRCIKVLVLVFGAAACDSTDKGSGGDAVGRPPTVEITAPLDGEMVDPDTLFTIAATVGDDNTPPQELDIVVSTEDGGEIPHEQSPNEAGDFKAEIQLSSGPHVLVVTATDENGETGEDQISVNANGRPSAPIVQITPAEPELTDDLMMEMVTDAVDPDGDDITYKIGWTVLNPGMETSSVYNPSEPGIVPSDVTERGAIWTVTVVPSDAYGEGTEATAEVMVANGAPSIESVVIEPEEPRTADTLTAVVSGFTDPDGDPEELIYQWTLNGDVVEDIDGATFPFTEHNRDDVIEVMVTPVDLFSEGDPLTSEAVTILNTAPSASSVDIDPGSPRTGDALGALTLGWNDADGDAENYQYRWFANGLEDSTETTSTYPSSLTSRGGVYQVEVTPDDGIDLGEPLLSDEVTVGNTIPSITGAVLLSPTAPTTVDNITATPTGWSDDDGDPESYSFEWTVNGSPVSTTGDTLSSSNFVRDDTVQVSVTPLDTLGSGDPVIGGPVTIGNAAPTIGSASITPNPARTEDTLTCDWSGFSDADGDDDQSTVEWFVEGTSAGTSLSLSGSFTGGETVTCVVTPYDGIDTGAAASATLIIDNTAPSVESVTITPDPALATDTLTCSWSGFTDADGDADASTARWTINGTPVGTGVTLAGGFIGGDTVTCLVLPSDGTSTGSEVSTSVVISNSRPSIEGVSISSSDSPPVTSSTLTCNWTGFSDADGDTDASTVAWHNSDGTEVGTEATLSGVFSGGSILTCTVTPFDGHESGTPLTSDSITIDNTAPVLELAALTPDPAFTDNTMVCSPGAITDADGDTSFTYDYRWFVGGVLLVSETSSSLGSSHYTRGQTVNCEITPSDGTDSGAAVVSNIVTIQNSRPVVESLTLAPSSVATNDVITVSVTVSDADEEATFTLIEWKVDGAVVLSGYTATTLNGVAYFDKGQVITVDVTPEDGTEYGATTTGGPIVVENTPPVAPDVEVSPSAPEPDDDLECEIVTDSADLDDDAITYSYDWYVDGAATSHTGDTLSSAFTAHDERWECEVTPNDGEEDGTSATDSVVINDLTVPDPPEFDDENIYTNDTTRAITGDCEADCAVEVTCNDGSGSTVDTTTCSSSGSFSITLDFVRGDITTCTATCTDVAGNESGASDEVVVESCDPEDIYEDSAGSGDSPGDVIDGFATLPDDALDTITIEGNIVDGDSSDWYVISTTDDVAEDLAAGVDYFNFHVQMTDGTGDYRMQVFKGSSGAGDEECPTEDGYTDYNWFPQDVGDGSHSVPSDSRSCSSSSSSSRNECEDNTDDFYIHIYRLGGLSPSCQSYELTINNGVW